MLFVVLLVLLTLLLVLFATLVAVVAGGLGAMWEHLARRLVQSSDGGVRDVGGLVVDAVAHLLRHEAQAAHDIGVLAGLLELFVFLGRRQVAIDHLVSHVNGRVDVLHGGHSVLAVQRRVNMIVTVRLDAVYLLAAIVFHFLVLLPAGRLDLKNYDYDDETIRN